MLLCLHSVVSKRAINIGKKFYSRLQKPLCANAAIETYFFEDLFLFFPDFDLFSQTLFPQSNVRIFFGKK